MGLAPYNYDSEFSVEDIKSRQQLIAETTTQPLLFSVTWNFIKCRKHFHNRIILVQVKVLAHIASLITPLFTLKTIYTNNPYTKMSVKRPTDCRWEISLYFCGWKLHLDIFLVLILLGIYDIPDVGLPKYASAKIQY